ncbi:MAG: hypothetical protein KGN79_03910 [Acidobacteriota bacterium]|nr:hypothetical protein [Acidobacteriota bacterium]
MANAGRRELEAQHLKQLREKNAARKKSLQEPAREEEKEETAGGRELPMEQKLGKAAEKELRRVGSEMSKSLANKAAKGDVASAKLLLQLVEKGGKGQADMDKVEVRAALDAMINEWANGPEWTGPKYGEEYLRLCNEQGVRDAQKAGLYGSELLGSQVIDRFRYAGSDRADASFKEIAGLLGECGIDTP